MSVYQFADFELNTSRFELRRNGRTLKLERIPMELLILLVEKQGDIASRQEIVDRLWGKNVFVDTEHGINTAIRKIRAALRENVERPRFIQTVSGKGYRFVPEPKTEQAKTANSEQGAVAAAVLLPPTPIPTPSKRLWQFASVSLIALLFVAAVGFGFNIAGVRDRVFAAHSIGPIHSIAVIPLINLSGDASQDYYVDGITDEMITALAHTRSLRVISRTSAMQFKGVNKPLRDIAQSLGVDGILEGSVMRSNGQVHVNLQLIYAPTDTHVWAQSYNRDSNEAMTLPDEIAQIIAIEAKVATAGARPHRYINPQAYDAYLRGRYFWFATNIPKSIEYFQKAIQLQPDYAAAWVGIGDAYLQSGENAGYTSLEACTKEEEAVQKAMSLDDSVPEVHNSAAAYDFFCKWDFPSADKESLRAIELDPNYAEGHFMRSQVLVVMNRDSEALEQGKLANELAPYERTWGLEYLYIHLRRIDDAINESKLRIEGNPNDTSVLPDLAEAYWIKGMYKEAEDTLEKWLRAEGQEKAAIDSHRAFEKGGKHGVAQLGLEDLQKRARVKSQVTSWDLAMQYGYLGDKEHALECLERGYHDHNTSMPFIQREPLFDSLHSDERYRTIVKNMGLPPVY